MTDMDTNIDKANNSLQTGEGAEYAKVSKLIYKKQLYSLCTEDIKYILEYTKSVSNKINQPFKFESVLWIKLNIKGESLYKLVTIESGLFFDYYTGTKIYLSLNNFVHGVLMVGYVGEELEDCTLIKEPPNFSSASWYLRRYYFIH